MWSFVADGVPRKKNFPRQDFHRLAEWATCAPPELSPRRDRRRATVTGRVVPGGKKGWNRKRRVSLSDPDHAVITVRSGTDIRGCLAGPEAESGVRFRAGVLMVSGRRRRVSEGTTRSDERQGQIEPRNPQCDDGDGCLLGG